MTFLDDKLFKLIVSNTPLFSIDIVLLNEKNEILTGLRNNPPAKNFWFLPGGRVKKNQILDEAFCEITKSELGKCLKYENSTLLGLHEHLWSDSIYGDDISTHYINAPMMIKKEQSYFDLPDNDAQHSGYKWTKWNEFEKDPSIHSMSKLFIPEFTRLNAL